MNTLWRSLFAGLATSRRARTLAQTHRIGIGLARQYTGGHDPEAATERAQRLYAEHGIAASLFHLGEYVRDAEAVQAEVRAKCAAAAALGRAGLDVHVSVDPTQIGLLQGEAVFFAHLDRIGRAIAEAAHGRPGRHALMLDMEDASVTGCACPAAGRRAAERGDAAGLPASHRRRSGAAEAQASFVLCGWRIAP